VQFTDEFIGSRLIETITSGLYDGNLNCLREYIQNGIDSNAKNINIYFENGGSDLQSLT
jgi:DNA mismatch repair ATPase MutL